MVQRNMFASCHTLASALYPGVCMPALQICLNMFHPCIAGSGEASRQLQIQSPDSGLFSCFALHVALAATGAQQAPPGTPQACFGVALWSNLPVPVPITRLEVRLPGGV